MKRALVLDLSIPRQKYKKIVGKELCPRPGDFDPYLHEADLDDNGPLVVMMRQIRLRPLWQ